MKDLKQYGLLSIGQKTLCWGALWYSKSELDGIKESIIYQNCVPALFRTKKEAMQFIKERYGYIAKRKDLRQEPFGWRMPRAVKISVGVIN